MLATSAQKKTVQGLTITTRSALVLGEGDNGAGACGNVQRLLNRRTAPFEPFRQGAADEAGNALPRAMLQKRFWRGAEHPSRRTGKGIPAQVNPLS